MAEVVAIMGMANAGFKLAKTLFSFAEAVGSVDKEIVHTAKDVSHFSGVLTYLVTTLERGQRAKSISKSAFEMIHVVIAECKCVFGEVEAMIQKSTKSHEVVKMKVDDMVPFIGAKLSVPLAKRLLYFFQKSKLEGLRRDLESLKTTLGLMLGALEISEKIEKAQNRKSGAAEALSEADRLKMECLVLANEAAAAEVRKHTESRIKKTEDKEGKEKMPGMEKKEGKEKKLGLEKKLAFGKESKARKQEKEKEGKEKIITPSHHSIVEDGVLGRLTLSPPACIENPDSKPAEDTISNVVPLLDGSGNSKSNESKVSVNEMDQAVNALLALWLVNLGQQNEEEQSKDAPEERKRNLKKKHAGGDERVDLSPKRESKPYGSQKEFDARAKEVAEEVEREYVHWSPKRESRPYGPPKNYNVTIEEVEEESDEKVVDVFPKREPRPYRVKKENDVLIEEVEDEPDKEVVNLFPKREPRPYRVKKDNDTSIEEMEEEPDEELVDLFPKREPRPYCVKKDNEKEPGKDGRATNSQGENKRENAEHVSTDDIAEEPIDLFPRRAPRPY